MKIDQMASRVSSRGLHFNTGAGSTLQPIDIGHADYLGVVDPDTAFWALIRKDKLADAFNDGPFLKNYRRTGAAFAKEMDVLRFGLKPSAVYFNPTDRCNLNCSYCYIPEKLRRDGTHMSQADLFRALKTLKEYFSGILPSGVKPQIIFHGAEPTMNREALFAGLDHFKNDFRFGLQTNGTLLEDADIEFLTSRNIAIGLSLDSHSEAIATRTRTRRRRNSKSNTE